MTTVRVVDDTEDIAALLRAMLQGEGYTVETTTADFVDLLAPGPWGGVDVAVVDLMLPKVSGARILVYLAEHHPHIRRVLWTANPLMAGDADLSSLAHKVIAKPASIADIVEAVGADD